MLDTRTLVGDWVTEYGDPGLSVSWALCDRHDPAQVAFVLIDSAAAPTGNEQRRDLTYGELAEQSRRVAAALAQRGVRRGDRVPVLMGKRAELVVTLLALWRLGAVHIPLFTAFEHGAIDFRVCDSRARLVITESAQRHKLDSIDVDSLDVDVDFETLLTAAPLAESVAVGGDGAFVQLYTSGTTGKPKGVVVPGRAIAAFRAYQHYGLDVQSDDVFWNAADPGWAYGLYYAIIGPMAAARPSLLYRGGFTPESTARIMRAQGVTNFAAAPTIYRALSQAPAAVVGDLPTLRRASAAGEPLTPEVVDWGQRTLGVQVRDHYGQTEMGMVIANGWHGDVRAPLQPGSMGRALPGFTAAIVDGQIAIAADSPLLWFDGYNGLPAKTAERYSPDGAWYLTGDTGRIGQAGAADEGYVYFTARDDDVIMAAGYRIGPFDVESVLTQHAAVADVAVVGRPDPEGIRGEIVEAFIVTAAGHEPSEALADELKELVRTGYSKHAYPRVVTFVDTLPRTPSGKVQRFLLRQR